MLLLYYCSFCRKSKKDVKVMIAGPDRINICNECVEHCNWAIAKELGSDDVCKNEDGVMKVKRGMIVQTDFGKGEVVAVTKTWLIHNNEDGDEICVNHEADWVGIPVEIDGVDVPDNEIEIDKEGEG